MATVITGQNLPPPQSAFVNPPGATGGIVALSLSYDGYQFLINLLSNALSSGITSSVGTGLVAKGSNQATALLLTNDWNEIDSGTGGVLLASLQAGQNQVVFNNTGGSINVYPPPGSQINALGLNAAFVLTNATRATFDFFSSTQIRT